MTKWDSKTNQKIGTLQLDKPVEVLFEGLDTAIYKHTTKIHDSINEQLSQVKENFAFLFVGHWLRGDLGHDRKDVGMLIKTFAETFKNKASHNKPALVLKTSHAGFSIMDRDEILKKIQILLEPYGTKAPSVYLLHGDLTDEEMNSLYNHSKIKAMVSFTKGEGFGRPLLEFTATGKTGYCFWMVWSYRFSETFNIIAWRLGRCTSIRSRSVFTERFKVVYC
jgi:hypothetical protein